jgi:hypothetical protein
MRSENDRRTAFSYLDHTAEIVQKRFFDLFPRFKDVMPSVIDPNDLGMVVKIYVYFFVVKKRTWFFL